MDIKDVVIIGAGPAGIATAIQLKRYNIKPVLLEQDETGGLLRNANLIENYPGFPEGINGLELVELFKKHLKNNEVIVNFEKALELEYCDNIFSTATDRRVLKSTIVVIATGTKPRKISDLNISDDIKDQIFYEIYTILGIKNKKIAIIGDGDAAFDYALNLCTENEVMILNRGVKAKCLPVLAEKCMKSGNISYSCNINVTEINNVNDQLRLNCIHSDTRDESQIDADYVVIAIGREPCLDFLGSEIKNNIDILLKSNVLYMVGDIKNKIYRQTAICIGDGIKCGMEIYRNIRSGNA